MRLEKFLSQSGIASRRDAKKYISAGRVTVNGEKVLIPGTHIDPQKAEITFDGEPIRGKPKRIYLMLNKPAGYVTTVRDERGRPTVMALVSDISERIYPIGRLDVDTEGLLLMTNDGDFTHRILHPSHETQKTYIAWVEGKPNRQAIQRLREGIEIEEGVITSAKINQIGKTEGQTQFKDSDPRGKETTDSPYVPRRRSRCRPSQTGGDWIAFAGTASDREISPLNINRNRVARL